VGLPTGLSALRVVDRNVVKAEVLLLDTGGMSETRSQTQGDPERVRYSRIGTTSQSSGMAIDTEPCRGGITCEM